MQKLKTPPFDERHGRHQNPAARTRFSQSNGHAAKKQAVLDRLAAFFERYFGLA